MEHLMKRKLVSVHGFKGYTSMLRPGEILIMEITDRRGIPRDIKISSEVDFERVQEFEGTQIVGYFAKKGG